MVHPSDAGRHPSSLERGRERDDRICWLLREHPVTARQLVDLSWFGSKNKALARLRKLARRGRIHLVGTLSRRGGRPEHVYCRWRPRPQALIHELDLTELCLRLPAEILRRGPGGADRVVLPDAEAVIGGEVYYIELDRGTMCHAQMTRRFRLYEGCPHFSLWVCATAQRREEMRRLAGSLRATALFATLGEVMAAPRGAVWWGVAAGPVALPTSPPPRPADPGLSPG